MLNFSEVTETYLRTILPDKLRLDLLYVRNRSLMLNFDILVQTMLVLIPRFRKATLNVEDMLRWPFRLARQRLSWFAIDAAIAFLAVTLASALWRSAGPMHTGIGRSLIAALFMTAVFSMMNWLTGVQRIQWRYANPSEVVGVLVSASAATLLLVIANLLVQPSQFPTQMLIMTGIFALSGFIVARYRRRLLQDLTSRIENLPPIATAGRERVLVVGAGDAAQLTILLLRNNPAGRAFRVIGVVDDDLSLLGTSLHRVPVLGVCDRIPEIVREKDVGIIVFAIHNIEDSRLQNLIRCCQETSARMVAVPDLLSSLRQDATRESVALDESGLNIAAPQSGTAYQAKQLAWRRRIQLLAELARDGDNASVVLGLSKLEKELEEAEADTLAGN